MSTDNKYFSLNPQWDDLGLVDSAYLVRLHTFYKA